MSHKCWNIFFSLHAHERYITKKWVGVKRIDLNGNRNFIKRIWAEVENRTEKENRTLMLICSGLSVLLSTWALASPGCCLSWCELFSERTNSVRFVEGQRICIDTEHYRSCMYRMYGAVFDPPWTCLSRFHFNRKETAWETFNPLTDESCFTAYAFQATSRSLNRIAYHLFIV